jgi:hypothetical protein
MLSFPTADDTCASKSGVAVISQIQKESQGLGASEKKKKKNTI